MLRSIGKFGRALILIGGLELILGGCGASFKKVDKPVARHYASLCAQQNGARDKYFCEAVDEMSKKTFVKRDYEKVRDRLIKALNHKKGSSKITDKRIYLQLGIASFELAMNAEAEASSFVPGPGATNMRRMYLDAALEYLDLAKGVKGMFENQRKLYRSVVMFYKSD